MIKQDTHSSVTSAFVLSHPSAPSLSPAAPPPPVSLDEVCRVLKQEGFSQVTSVRQLEGQTFCQDPHCDDMLVFPATIKADLYRTRLLSQYKLIIQVLQEAGRTEKTTFPSGPLVVWARTLN